MQVSGHIQGSVAPALQVIDANLNKVSNTTKPIVKSGAAAPVRAANVEALPSGQLTDSKESAMEVSDRIEPPRGVPGFIPPVSG